jgi:hypothetical protein
LNANKGLRIAKFKFNPACDCGGTERPKTFKIEIEIETRLLRERAGQKIKDQLPLKMQSLFSIQQHLFTLHMIFIRDATIYRAYGSTLRFVMKTFALGTFVWNDEIVIIGNGGIRSVCSHLFVALQYIETFYGSTIRNGPFHAALVDSGVGAFGFAGAAIDTFICYSDGHNSLSVF